MSQSEHFFLLCEGLTGEGGGGEGGGEGGSGGLGLGGSGGLGLGGSGGFQGARSCLLAEAHVFPAAKNVLPLHFAPSPLYDTVHIVTLGVILVPIFVGERTSADPFIVAFFSSVAKTNPGPFVLVPLSHLFGCSGIGSIQDGGEVATLLLAFPLTVSIGEVLLDHEVDGSFSGGLGFGGSGGLGFSDSGGLGLGGSGGRGFSDSGGLGLGDSGSIRSSFRGARSF